MEEEVPEGRASARLAWAGLALAVLAVVVRFILIARTAFSYDEATYVEIARHPWTSSYYPDAIFVRHPPVYFLLLWGWTAAAGTSEIAVRIPSFIAALAGVALTWSSVRRLGGDASAALAGFVLASSFLVLAYALQATMYPLAFALVALGLWANVNGRARLETACVALLPLVHLFGFLIAGALAWRRRSAHPGSGWVLVPGLVWVVAAGVAVLLTRPPAGPAFGPLWQGLRLAAIVYEAFASADGLVLHVLAVVLALLMLGPLLLWRGWRLRDRWTPWGWAGAILVVALVPGPGFLRYPLLALPIVLVAALPAGRVPVTRRFAAATVVFAVLAAAAGASYVAGRVDGRAGNDVPGLVDWREVADGVSRHPAAVVFTSAPTALAYYLGKVDGATVVDASAGPGRLILSTPHGPVELVEMPLRAALPPVGPGGVTIVLPETWTAVAATLEASGYVACVHVSGAFLFRDAETRCDPVAAQTADA